MNFNAKDGLDVQSIAERFWQDGYIVIDNFFQSEIMEKYNDLILKHFGQDPKFTHNQEFLDKSDVEVIPWFPQREGVPEFDVVYNDAKLNEITEAILGADWYSQYSMVMFSKNGTKGQAWHQDCPPEDAGKFNMNRLVYSMDIDPAVGGQTMVVRGSHKRGLLPANDHDQHFEEEVVLTPRKGTLVLLHGHCWHKVTPVTGAYRFSTNYRSAPKDTPEDITDICVYRNMRYQFSTSEVVEDRLVSS